jgi:hypothetical protein
MGYKEFVAVLIICCAIGCSPVSTGENIAPEIKAITFTPEMILAGESCLIKCTAVDSNNDNLTYEWESVGYIYGSGSCVYYTPSSCCGVPRIKVTVKDGRGKSIDSSFSVPFEYDIYE